MTYEQFRKAFPAVRSLQLYSSEARAAHAASHRLYHRQKASVGEYFYTHNMVPNIAFKSAKAATTRASQVFTEQAA